MESALCSCDTHKPFADCCGPVLSGKKIAETAVELMRARYTAFARHNVDFILNSTAPTLKKELDRNGIEEWSKNSNWEGLEIISTKNGGANDEQGQIEFKARFREKEEAKVHHELATFVKIKGAWFFEDGHAPAGKPVKLEGPKIGRNDPCHCGSGKKFKKCHGKE